MSLLVKHLYRFGPFHLDAEQRLVRRNDAKIALPPKAFDLLLYMVRNPLRLLTKEELLRAIWPDSFVEEGNLSQNIFLLRKALTSKESDLRYIVTIPGRGYQFATPVELISQLPQNETSLSGEEDIVVSSVRSTMHIVVHEEIDDSPALPFVERRSSVERRRHLVAAAAQERPDLRYVIAALLLVAAIIGSLVWWKSHHQPAESQKVVLADFENRTGDSAFDVVLKKALEIDLGQSPYMDVMSEQEATGMLQLMGRKQDAAITGEVATEVCQRGNRQVMLKGSIANLGGDYLIVLQAIDCLSGKKLAEAKTEAANKPKVLNALDLAADKIRHALGESGRSVEQFQVPIAQATTSSLEALKAYSIGEDMVGNTGKEETETLPMFQRCIELDPQFAMAYVAIATDYYSLNESNLAMPFYQKAFDLSGQVSEKEKLYIRAHYYADDRKDLEQGVKEYQLWAETYPRDWGPWLNIAKAYTQLGQFTPAVAAAEQALKLDSTHAINYTVLAQAYMRLNRFSDAKATALQAEAQGKESYGLHAILFQIAFVEHDQAAMAREIAWSQGRPSAWYSLQVQAFAAATAGKYKQAEDLFQSAYNVAQRENLAETADDILINQASAEFESGQLPLARTTLNRVKRQDSDNPSLAFYRATLGDIPFAERFLAAYDDGANHPGTLMTYVDAPRLRAEIDLHREKPLDAIAALQTAAPYELGDGLKVIAQRGEAYLHANQPEQAAAEYKKILSHQGADPISPLYPLAHLWLARADAQAGHLPESKSEYEILFALWKDADKDLPVLVAAHKEYAALKTSPHAKISSVATFLF
jgi:DNA-binding winged helix-turn-helix (wHTH) protein/tetratricopeptide (TPR) repeat protein